MTSEVLCELCRAASGRYQLTPEKNVRYSHLFLKKKVIVRLCMPCLQQIAKDVRKLSEAETFVQWEAEARGIQLYSSEYYDLVSKRVSPELWDRIDPMKFSGGGSQDGRD